MLLLIGGYILISVVVLVWLAGMAYGFSMMMCSIRDDLPLAFFGLLIFLTLLGLGLFSIGAISESIAISERESEPVLCSECSKEM